MLFGESHARFPFHCVREEWLVLQLEKSLTKRASKNEKRKKKRPRWPELRLVPWLRKKTGSVGHEKRATPAEDSGTSKLVDQESQVP